MQCTIYTILQRPVRSRRHPLSPTNCDSVAATGSNYSSSALKLQEVEKIVEQLQEKHATSYSHWKLNVLLHMGKHHSYETPPNLPCFGKAEDCNKDKQKSLPSDSQKAQATEISSSPSKRQGLCWECIEQLSKWHASLEKGGITLQQYEKLKELSWVTFSSSYRTTLVSLKLNAS